MEEMKFPEFEVKHAACTPEKLASLSLPNLTGQT